MPDYRRYRVSGGIYFFHGESPRTAQRFTDTVDRRLARGGARHAPATAIPYRCLGRLARSSHCLWTLPAGDTDFSRWKAIKIRFVHAIAPTGRRSAVRVRRGERGVWQRRFWEHAIRDEEDYARHLDYIHYNPIQHGWVTAVKDWPYSTFHRWVKQGGYPMDWGGRKWDDIEFGERP